MRKIKVVVLLVRQLQHGFTKNTKVSPNLTVTHIRGSIRLYDYPLQLESRIYRILHRCDRTKYAIKVRHDINRVLLTMKFRINLYPSFMYRFIA